MRIYLIRHGETAFNKDRVMQGHSPVPLNDTGIDQATRLGRRLAGMPLDHIYASDLKRTEMTAEILAKAGGDYVRGVVPGAGPGGAYEHDV